MSQLSTSPDNATAYIFRFDAPFTPRIFGDEYDISGWLLHSGGKPINGIRAVLKRPLAHRQIFSARRKRDRPDVAAAFPHLAEAKASGFLLELRLGLGRNHLTLQVLDHDRAWRTFQTVTITAFPLLILRRMGFRNLRRFLLSCLKRSYSEQNRLLNQSKLDRNISISHSAPEPLRTQQVDLFATSKSNLFILEIAELVAAGFREMGRNARLYLDKMPARNPPADTLQIVVTPHEYYNLFLTDKVSREEARDFTRSVVLLSTEQPETGWFQSNLQWAAYARGVSDISTLGVLAYRVLGFPSHHFPLGYHPILTAPKQVSLERRRYDITFLGSMTPRRDNFFTEHAPFFAAHRCHIRLVPLGFAKTKVTRSYLSSERRNELLSQSRILLNVHYSEREYMEWHRILVGLANGCCVISETSEAYGKLVPGRHFIMADRQDLIACCDYYLSHPDEAQTIGQRGMEFVQTQLRQAQACETFLHELEAGERARQGAIEIPLPPVCVDVSPVVFSGPLRRKLSVYRVCQFGRALADDLRTLLAPSTDASSVEPLLDAPTEQRRSVMQRRQGYEARWQEQENRRAQNQAAWKLHDNTFYESARPRLSVVITLFNYPHYIADCVRSIDQAIQQMSDPVEVVIVNDASTDDSMAEALRCQAASTLPIRIVDKVFNTGLADARNVGTQLARAPYVFMMDADNLIFPNGLRELLETVQRDNYTAAYSLLCRFKGTPANRIGLLSQYDWDPQILVQHPYIDAMAIFRRDTLLKLGGYDNQLSQIGWFGWEDYDMWLRFAQNNYPVGFVPNILCLYRYHETSMINVTNLFEADLVQHFLERYRELVGHFEPHETLFGVERTKIARAMEESTQVEESSVGLAKTVN